jgi:hypothetical protein
MDEPSQGASPAERCVIMILLAVAVLAAAILIGPWFIR